MPASLQKAKIHARVLPMIVFAQFCCTSLWFASNAVMGELIAHFQLPEGSLSYLTSAVQLGFISGTLAFALLNIADRFSPSKVFFTCALLGAAFNACAMVDNNQLYSLLLFRLLTGFCLAGIYPVGMKIAADYYEKGLGKSLGYLVGALVLGTAFPHFIKGFATELPWRSVLVTTSAMATIGGLSLLIWVPDGPYRQPLTKFAPQALIRVFKDSRFRAAALGYFGHMWELYAFWAFIPVLLTTYAELHPATQLNHSLLSFTIIGIGSLACITAGYLSQIKGAKPVASLALLLSGLCCLLAPIALRSDSSIFFIGFLLFWGWMVIADSPLFSSLVAKHAPAANKGTALTIINSIGFAITIVSIQLLDFLIHLWDAQLAYLCLALGPLLGILVLFKKAKDG